MISRDEIRRNFKPIVKINYTNRTGIPELDEYAELYYIAPNVIYTIVQGRMRLSGWKAITAEISQQVAANKQCDMFHDCFSMFNYEKGCINYSINWLKQHDCYFKKAHVGTGSKIVAFATNIISTVSGVRLGMFSDKDEFYFQLNQKLIEQEVYL